MLHPVHCSLYFTFLQQINFLKINKQYNDYRAKHHQHLQVSYQLNLIGSCSSRWDAQESLCTVFIECNKIFLLLFGLKNILCHLSKAKLYTETFRKRLQFVNLPVWIKTQQQLQHLRWKIKVRRNGRKDGRVGERVSEELLKWEETRWSQLFPLNIARFQLRQSLTNKSSQCPLHPALVWTENNSLHWTDLSPIKVQSSLSLPAYLLMPTCSHCGSRQVFALTQSCLQRSFLLTEGTGMKAAWWANSLLGSEEMLNYGNNYFHKIQYSTAIFDG